MDYNQLTLLYNQFFTISLEIATLIDEKNFEELPQIISKRDKIIELLVEIKKENPNIQDYPADLQELIKKLESQDSKNIERLENIREGLRKELEKTSKNSRLVSAYAQDIVGSNIVDILE